MVRGLVLESWHSLGHCSGRITTHTIKPQGCHHHCFTGHLALTWTNQKQDKDDLSLIQSMWSFDSFCGYTKWHAILVFMRRDIVVIIRSAFTTSRAFPCLNVQCSDPWEPDQQYEWWCWWIWLRPEVCFNVRSHWSDDTVLKSEMRALSWGPLSMCLSRERWCDRSGPGCFTRLSPSCYVPMSFSFSQIDPSSESGPLHCQHISSP